MVLLWRNIIRFLSFVNLNMLFWAKYDNYPIFRYLKLLFFSIKKLISNYLLGKFLYNFIYSPPKIVRNIFSSFQWQSKSDKILLTFDDGPEVPTLDIILNFLQKHKLNAAFFLVGNQAKKNPGLVAEIRSEGHLIANHTQNHQDIILCSKQKIYSEISTCSAELEKITGDIPTYFRPPHGRFDWRTAKIMQEMNLKCIMWSLLTGDFKNNRRLSCNLVENYLTKNSIVTLHDNLKSQDVLIPVLETILEISAKKGFVFGKPFECLK